MTRRQLLPVAKRRQQEGDLVARRRVEPSSDVFIIFSFSQYLIHSTRSQTAHACLQRDTSHSRRRRVLTHTQRTARHIHALALSVIQHRTEGRSRRCAGPFWVSRRKGPVRDPPAAPGDGKPAVGLPASAGRARALRYCDANEAALLRFAADLQVQLYKL